MRLGGFYSVPRRNDLKPLAEHLRRALDDALFTVRSVAEFDFPDAESDHELLALTQPDRYAIENGTIRRSAGPAFAVAEFSDHVTESQVPHSTALHATLDGARYLTGPLARYSLNSAALSPIARQAAADAGLGAECRNPFRSIVVRAVEVVYAIEESLRIIDEYEQPPRPFVDVPARAGIGHGVSEAPRGLLYHRYEIGDDGLIRAATIVPPTAQNQAAIEHEMAQLVAGNLSLDDATLTSLCERSIRNHDPCISCSAHFLDAHCRAAVNDDVVIGIGNTYRRDDGVGLAVADELAKRDLPGVRMVTAIGEPGAILEAWSGVALAVVVDAALEEGSTPGRIRRWKPCDVESHGRREFACAGAAADLRVGPSPGADTRRTRCVHR